MTVFRSWRSLLAIVLTAVLLGGLLASIDGKGGWLQGFFAYSLLCGLGLGAIWGVSRLLGGSSSAARAAYTAFFLRLVVGAGLTLLLPVAGYQNSEVTRAGYVFYDASIRDRQAFSLAEYGGPLLEAFTEKSTGDQYGGMLALSALVYRYLSPGVHRPMLPLALTAAAAALGVLFLWKAGRAWFGEAVGSIAAWIFALYPESVLLGSSQMREPFVISAIALAFFAVVEMRKESKVWLAWLAIAGIVLFLFQPPLGLVAFIILFVAWILDPNRKASWKRFLLFAGLLLVGILLVFSVWASLPALQKAGPGSILFNWLEKNFQLQTYLTGQGSAILRRMFRQVQQWKPLIVLAYGAAQPVLPAAIVDPTGAWIWRVINTFTSAGWYLLAPFLAYGFMNVLRPPAKERRAQLAWFGLAIAAWILIAAASGGADQTDNPRYRTLLLAWQALLAAWAYIWARSHRDAWLPRWIAAEAACVLLFIEWYLSRYYPLFPQLNIWIIIVLCLLVSAAILVGGWFLDRTRRVASREETANVGHD